MDKNKTVYAVVGIIIVIILFLFLMKSREDLAGKAISVYTAEKGNCASISPDPEKIPQVLNNGLVVFTIEPLSNVAEITTVEGSPGLDLQFYEEAKVITLKPLNVGSITINCKIRTDQAITNDVSEYNLGFV